MKDLFQHKSQTLDDVTARYTKLQGQHEKLRNDQAASFRELKSKVFGIEAIKKKLSDEFDKLTSDHAELRCEHDECPRKINDLGATNQSLRATMDRQQRQLDEKECLLNDYGDIINRIFYEAYMGVVI